MAEELNVRKAATVPELMTRPDAVFDSDEANPSLPEVFRNILKPLASLKLTVALFAASIFLIFAGTLVQTRMDIWHVMDLYFRNWFAFIELKAFFPPAWIPGLFPKAWQSYFLNIPGGFYFPGGFLIGLLMFLNLSAAHLIRFTVQAKGMRLWAGLGVLGCGIILTYFVVQNGSNSDGVQGVPMLDWNTLWWVIKISLGLLSVAGAFFAGNIPGDHRLERWFVQSSSVLIGLLAAWLLYQGNRVQLGDSSMRILWQLIQGTIAGCVLLAGSILVFKKRAGVVLLHAGVGLMMLSELMVAQSAKESQMYITEGESQDHSVDTRAVELAVIDRSDAKLDQVVVVPANLLRSESVVKHVDLPFDLEVVKYLVNAKPRALSANEKTLATVGTGLKVGVDELPPTNGVDTDSKVDAPAAYVRFLNKANGAQLGTYLLIIANPQDELMETITVDGKKFEVALRFEHVYPGYKIKLVDFRFDKYPGTSTPKNYSSDIEIQDPTTDGVRSARVWMNNPLRYKGMTYYQSGFDPSAPPDRQTTILQVVTNHGWMIPYVSCMIVSVGMMFHFSLALQRFLNRGERGLVVRNEPFLISNWYLPGGFGLILLIWMGTLGSSRPVSDKEMNLEAFGKLPIMDHGRAKPIDSFARINLRIVSNSEEPPIGENKRLNPTKWLLDLISESNVAFDHQVVRIDFQEVLDFLKLDRRKSLRYSLRELQPKIREIEELEKTLHAKMKSNSADSTVFERRILELANRIRVMSTIEHAFSLPPLDYPTQEEIQQDREAAMMKLQHAEAMKEQFVFQLFKYDTPSVVPLLTEEEKKNEPVEKWKDWRPLSYDTLRALDTVNAGGEVPQTTRYWLQMLIAYRKGDVKEFNSQVEKYRSFLEKEKPADLNLRTTDYEVKFNRIMPFYNASVLYLVAFGFTALSWLVWTKPLNRIALATIVVTLLLHTWALYARMQISGRPPVTNLYTTAVFIGWATVLFGVIFESIYRIGIGNILASTTGYATLLISHGLMGEGDTFTVLQAVLDTQFWLATHVVTINLGYGTTFVAGTLGIIYVLQGVLTPSQSPETAKHIVRMIYGTLCFGMLFSFVGTVLGGLWGDDSWGRFWGWDPKENGALIIVLWNALVLHARWDGMVKDRGLAVLAIGGNIWTAWSWFGVNQLGVGLHAYGSTEGTLMKLALFSLSQLVIIGLGVLPRKYWWSTHTHGVRAASGLPVRN